MTIDEPVLVDTSAIVALTDHTMPNHDDCIAVSAALPAGKTFTCWPVITEAAYLVRKNRGDVDGVFAAVRKGVIQLLMLSADDISSIQAVFAKYHDQDVDLADAALVHLAQREKISAVFTLDRRHFRVYSCGNGKPFRLLHDDA